MTHFSRRLQEQFEVFPDAPAIRFREKSNTFAQLSEQSARFGGAFEKLASDPRRPVALLMNQGPELIAAILGAVRIGRPYVVLNPSHTLEQLRQICLELHPSVLSTDPDNYELAIGMNSKAIIVGLSEVAAASAFYSFRSMEESAVLGIFYTSGSAGFPRPFIYTYGGTWNALCNHAEALVITAQDRLSLLSPCSAAASVSGLFGALLNGACLLPFNPAGEGWRRMSAWLDRSMPTVLHLVPTLFRRFAEGLNDQKTFPSVRAIKFGGEPLFPSDLQWVKRHFPRCSLVVNGLGATEANGNICHFRLNPLTFCPDPECVTIPIGSALPGYEIRLVDEQNREVSSGEIVVRGRFLSPGVWPGKDSGESSDSSRWLATGDLGQQFKDGSFLHLGRKDDQFKFNGLWMTPSLVEAALLTHPGIREAACVALPAGPQRGSLAVFLVWRENEIANKDLRDFLRDRLPTHLMPKHYFALKQLPRLSNEKVNRALLSKQSVQDAEKLKPGSSDADQSVEVQLTRIWEASLGMNGIGLDDDYFTLGGDSLVAAEIFAGIAKFFGSDLPVGTLLEAPTIRTLAGLIRKGSPSGELKIVGLQLRGRLPPIFCVPGAGSDALSLRSLALHLGNDQPFFAFQPKGLDGTISYSRTVEESAQRNIEALQVHCPSGPYSLCGTSFGGVVAFEMAQQMQAVGRPPALVAVIDTRIGKYPKIKKILPLRNWHRLIVRPFLPEFHEEDRITKKLLARGLQKRVERTIVNLDLAWGFKKLPRPYALRFVYLREACRMARRSYRAKPLDGKIHLFRTSTLDQSLLYEKDPLLGWQGLAKQGFEVQEIPGKHGEYLREPHVKVLAEKLRDLLQRTNR